MVRCPDCGCRLRHADEECPECRFPAEPSPSSVTAGPLAGEIATAVDGEPRVAIARFRNGAEAGYFADELIHIAELDVEVLARERFDAVHAAWSIDYLLLTSTADAARAAQFLRALVASSDEDAEPATGDADAARCDPSRSAWMPLILSLAAGSIACWGVEQAEQRPRPRPPALVDRDPRIPHDLWRVLSATPGPWRQTAPDGHGSREVTFDHERRTAVLREDRDGDGTIDREWRIEAAR
jgi:hypothetical protein